jgi:hypothetical protein
MEDRLMKTTLMAAAAASALFFAAPAAAQEGTAAGMAGGAATGAVIGGPVGAVVGGVAGAMVGTAIDPPPTEVQSYVVAQPVDPVTIEGEIVVGQPLPETVVVHPVPEYQTFSYAYVNGQPVIVRTEDRAVVQVVAQ